ncbi:putative serine protease EDA2-like protein, partial [Trifolium pratense]
DAYAKYVGTFGVNVQIYDQEYLKKTEINEDSSSRLWWFQVCTEVAYFQVAPSNDSIRSSKIDTKYHLDLCKNVFGDGIFPVVDATNLYYGGTKIAGLDPWRRASKQTSSPDMPSYLIACNNCGHCTDLAGCPQDNDTKCSSALDKVRQKIQQDMNLWLSECILTHKGDFI